MRIARLALTLAIAGCNPSIITGGGPAPGPGPGPGPGKPDGGVACDPKVDPSCGGGDTIVTLGPNQLDPKDDGSSGVKLGMGGGLVLDPGNYQSTTSPLIWIANSGEGTLSKVDTRTLKELARYRAGPGQAPDPSRTTVGLSGDVVVGDRFGNGATKIAADPSRCVDGNANGKIDTSTGANDVRPWGQDECVLWHVDFPQGAIARAAAFDAQVGIDGGDSSTVWIGLFGLMQMRQLDSKTGKELANIDVAPVRPYGAAIDKDGNVWVRGGGLVRIDPQHVVTHMNEQCGYGLAVDPQGRVWTGGPNCVGRYTPAQNKWDTVTVGGFNRGLAVDAKGSVWVADTDFGVHRIDANTMQVVQSVALPFSNTIGMAIDFDGMVWAISQGSSKATKIDPGTYGTQSIDTGMAPYTYSDMTGFQLRNAAAPFGRYRHVFAGCAANAKFNSLSWMAALPPATSLTVKGRVGADMIALASAPWVLLATSPPDMPPVDLTAKLGKNVGAFLEVEVTLKAVSPDVTPILQGLSLGMSCTPGIG